jgi:hypothetical protein
MRIDAEVHDHGLTREVKVFLDGEDVTADCVWADDETGEVCHQRRNARGEIVILGDAIARDVRKGEVSFRLPAGSFDYFAARQHRCPACGHFGPATA